MIVSSQNPASAVANSASGAGDGEWPIPPSVVLGMLCVVVAALNYVWLTHNTLPPHWDTANHMMSALKYRDVVTECASHSLLSFHAAKHCAGEIISVDSFVYPPLFPLAGGLLSFVTGTSITSLAMTNIPFLVLLIIAMCMMGAALHNRLAGVLAGLVVMAYPLVFQTSREFMLEFAMLAVTAASGAALILSDRFRRIGPTMLFGLTIGLGALTKFTFLTYLLGPGVYVVLMLIVDVVRHRTTTREAARRLMTIAGALALGLAVAAVWYLPHFVGFRDALETVVALDAFDAPRLSWTSLSYYLYAMIDAQMGPPLFVLFLVGLWLTIMRGRSDARAFLLVWIGSIYVIHTAVAAKAIHEDIGILVPAALVSAIGITHLPRYRVAGVALVVAFAALQFALLTAPESRLSAYTRTFGWTGKRIPYPRTEDWKVEPTLRTLASQPTRVAVVSDDAFINGTVVQFYALSDRLPLDVALCWRLGERTSDHVDLSRFDMVVAKSDTGWIRDKGVCFAGPTGRDQYTALLENLKNPTSGFHLVEQAPLPDGSSLLVYRNIQAERRGRS